MVDHKHDPETIPAEGNESPSRMVWVIGGVISITLIAVLFASVAQRDTSRRLSSDIAGGKRPYAPALPTERLSRSDDAPLPKWAGNGADAWKQKHPGQRDFISVVNFWASWCGPCKEEAPMLVEVAGDDGVVVVGVNGEDTRSDARAFVEQYGLNFAVIRDSGRFKREWGVSGFPETFVVGVDGRISAHFNGPLESGDLRAAITAERERSGDAG